MSVVKTSDELYNKLDQDLLDSFEDSIVSRYGNFVVEEDPEPGTRRRIAKEYLRAREAYLDALAAAIMYPDSLDYIDFNA